LRQQARLSPLPFGNWIKLSACLLVFFLPVYSVSSPSFSVTRDTLSLQQFIKGCAAYRQYVIHDIINVLTGFTAVSEELERTSPCPEAHRIFRNLFIENTLSPGHTRLSSSMHKAKAILHNRDDLALTVYQKWINANTWPLFELQFLVSNNILEARSPFVLTNLKNSWEEFSFYGLHAHMSIADIGAGNGFISFILKESGFPLNVVMTEIDAEYLDMLHFKVNQYLLRNPLDSIRVVKAEMKNLGLPDIRVDCILLREVFHHLKYPRAILRDIPARIHENGVVILKESTRDLKANKKERCNKAVSYAKIIRMMHASGFALQDEKDIDDAYLLKFRKG
jgi:2-polyprenyl-3-methyl-5-hydroxy-6-metoxy-1,4-benzoquinol methylase